MEFNFVLTQWVMSLMNDLATRKTGVKMTGFESKKAMSQDKFYNLISEQQLQEIMLKGIKDLTMQMEDLKRRVALMEKHQRDDGK